MEKKENDVRKQIIPGSVLDALPRFLFALLVCFVLCQGGAAQFKLAFESGEVYRLGSNTVNHCLADMNNDGYDDEVLVYRNPARIDVHMGDSKGRFLPPTTTPLSGVPTLVLEIADFDGNGILDVAVGVRPRTIEILLGDGRGRLIPVTRGDTFEEPLFSGTGDFDHDGNLDIAVGAGFCCGSVVLLLGDGRGRFSIHRVASVDQELFGFAVGDLNGDDNLDIAISEWQNVKNPYCVDEFARVLFGDGRGGILFEFERDIGQVGQLFIRDHDGDGNQDLLIARSRPRFGPAGSEIAYVLPGDGQGGFSDGMSIDPCFGTFYSARQRDLDGDGVLDLYGWASNSYLIAFGRADGGFDCQQVSGIGTMRDGDLNGDGFVDLLFRGGSGAYEVQWGAGNRVFHARLPEVLRDHPIRDVLAGDFNEDGATDLVITGEVRGPILGSQVLLGDGRGEFVVGYDLVETGARILSGDLNGDGHLDLILGNSVLLGTGTEVFNQRSSLPEIQDYGELGDFNKDGRLDLLYPRRNVNETVLLLGDGTGGFSTFATIPALPGVVLRPNEPLAVVDWDDDGNLDYIQGSHSLTVRFGDGAGQFTDSFTLPDARISSRPILGDFNEDGHVDLAHLHRDPGAGISVIFGNGERSLRGPWRIVIDLEQRALVAGDLNNDGSLDLVSAGSSASTVSVFLGDGQGSFSEDAIATAAFVPQSLSLGDLDGDQFLDVLVGHQQSYSYMPRGVERVSILWNRSRVATAMEGTVVDAAGDQAPLLTMNGSSGVGFDRRVFVAKGAPVRYELGLPPLHSRPTTRYVLWIHRGDKFKPRDLILRRLHLGLTPFPTPFEPLVRPQAKVCFRADGIRDIACQGVIEAPGPVAAPLTIDGGRFQTPRTFTFQALVEDDHLASPVPFRLSNAVVLVVE